MKEIVKRIAFLGMVVMFVFLLSCKGKKSSIAKVYVRSSNNELLADARVVIIADIDVNESSSEYVDTLVTNSSGFAEFNLDDYYKEIGKSVSVAKFNIVSRKGSFEGFGSIRTRVNTTAVETVRLSK